jgi:predicted dehydrogenase
VIGTGSIGYRHMQVLRSLEVPVVSISVRETRRMELEYEGWCCATSLGEAREAGAAFAVIATDTSRHVGDTEEALNSGLHVLLEKPMAACAPVAKHLPGMAAARKLGLFIGCPLRFDPGLGAVRKKMKEIGSVHEVRIECRSYLPDWRPNRDYRAAYSARADEGGVLRDLIHEIDYALWLFGIPSRVFGILRNLGRLGIQSEEMAEGSWIGPSGTNISIGLDYLSRHPRRILRAQGDSGELEYDFLVRRLRLRIVGARADETIDFPKRPNDLYVQQMSEFLTITEGGAARLITSAIDGVNALAVCDAWRRSAATGRIEQVAS